MKSWTSYTALIFGILLSGPPLFAIALHQPESIPYVRDLDQLKPTIKLDPVVKHVQLSVPKKILRQRTYRSPKSDQIPALSIKIPFDEVKLSNLASDLSRPGAAFPLLRAMKTAVKKAKNDTKNSKQTARFLVKPSFLKLVDESKLSQLLAQPHLSLTLASRTWTGSKPSELLSLVNQARPFLSKKTRRQLNQKVSRGQSIRIDSDLLPQFAIQRVGQFNSVQGPNCFHASLAFQGANLVKSPYINVKQEKGYHESMINYDELWRVLNTSFYEVDTRHSKLKYGDIIVFFDLPKQPARWVNYKSIRHASTYLFDKYTFSKGSKSPDSPYSVKTLPDEWAVWDRFSPNLGVKVYRRSTKHVRQVPPKNLADWVK